jgi:hypothetical protein
MDPHRFWVDYGKPEVIPLRRESAPVHLILRQNIPGALGDT